MLSRAVALFALFLTIAGLAHAGPVERRTAAMAALVNAYPDVLDRVDGNDLVWRDGARMKIDDGRGAKTLDEMLDEADIKDMFGMTYPLGGMGMPPDVDLDPGRVRSKPLFEKMYGDCRAGGFMANATKVAWLPGKYGKEVAFTRINGAAAALQDVSNELDKLPAAFLNDIRPTQGTYNCRPIAGTNRSSPHSFGIAIDIAAAHSDYWYWSKPDASGRIPYKN
jgi:hypothetical protein